MSDIVNAYLATWNETDPQRRSVILAEHWTPDATYTDPVADVSGRQQIDATVAAVQQQFGGLEFRPLGDADTHHNQTRFRWGLGPAGGDTVVEGSDVVLTDEQGRIRSVHGFLDKVPA